MENILCSLMKEIIQEYPQNEDTINNVVMYNNNEIGNSTKRFTINISYSY